MDIRENIEDFEEVIRACVTGLLKSHYHVLPGQVSEDSQDGHVASVQPTVQRAVTNPDGSLSYEDHPIHPDLPIHHMGGGGTSITHATKSGDTGAVLYGSRAIDTWFQSDGSQQPIDDRMHGVADGLFLSGIRSIPKKLQQVSQTSSQLRSDDKKHVIDHSPTDGTKIKAVDPSTAPASEGFDPFTQATKFFDHAVNPTTGHMATATDGGTVHSHSLDHDSGFKAQAANGAHSASVHPTNGVDISSTVAHTITAPNASLDKSGNLSNTGNHQVGQSVTAGQSVSAPTGTFAAGSIGGLSIGSGVSALLGSLGIMGGLGIAGVISAIGGAALQIGSALQAMGDISSGGMIDATGSAQGATLRAKQAFTVATLPSPAMALQGTHAFVTDAASPAFLQPLVGGGTKVCPAFCDGTNWVAH